MKQTEDQVIEKLIKHLEKEKWVIQSYCLGQKHGIDIVATKSKMTFIIEAKGAMAGKNSKTKKRPFFDSGQIKTHFGMAIVKILGEKLKNPERCFGIAHPDDTDIRNSIGKLIPFLKELNIKHIWVSENGAVSIE